MYHAVDVLDDGAGVLRVSATTWIWKTREWDGKAKFWDPKFGWRAATGGVCTGGWKIPALRGGKILFVGYDTYQSRELRATKSQKKRIPAFTPR